MHKLIAIIETIATKPKTEENTHFQWLLLTIENQTKY